MYPLSKYTIGSLLINLSLFLACKSSETTPSDRVSVSFSKSARTADNITVVVDSISDSRCPKNVQCIVAGWADVSLSLSREGEVRKRRLQFPGRTTDRTDSTTVQFSNTPYKVIVKDVSPYPELGRNASTKQVIVQVTKF